LIHGRRLRPFSTRILSPEGPNRELRGTFAFVPLYALIVLAGWLTTPLVYAQQTGPHPSESGQSDSAKDRKQRPSLVTSPEEQYLLMKLQIES
jgi:hypothetical protein